MPRCERSRLGTWCYLCGRLAGAGAVEDDGYWIFRLLLASHHHGASPRARQADGVEQPSSCSGVVSVRSTLVLARLQSCLDPCALRD